MHKTTIKTQSQNKSLGRIFDPPALKTSIMIFYSGTLRSSVRIGFPLMSVMPLSDKEEPYKNTVKPPEGKVCTEQKEKVSLNFLT